MTIELSVVMPVHNEAAHLPSTLDSLVEAVERSGFEAEVVLVDDGSNDGSAEVARVVLGDRLQSLVVEQANQGRLVARRSGLQVARGPLTLLLDARVRLERESLAFVRSRVATSPRAWTGHVHVDDGGNLYGVFWRVLAELAWRRYFDDPRTTSFGAADFDHFPKGSGCFLAPTDLLRKAHEALAPRYASARDANDDTPALRWIAGQERIGVSPSFAATYAPRSTTSRFVRHAVHRGIVFLDGHGRRESRFFPAAVAFFPCSAVLAATSLRRPVALPLAASAVGVVAGGAVLRAGKSPRDAFAVAMVAPLYAAGHGVGMWIGMAKAISGKRRA